MHKVGYISYILLGASPSISVRGSGLYINWRELYGAIWSYMELYGAIWSYMELYGAIYKVVGTICRKLNNGEL